MSDPYGELMPLVVDAKDLGSGVIRGVECDHLAAEPEKWIASKQLISVWRYLRDKFAKAASCCLMKLRVNVVPDLASGGLHAL